MKKDKNLELIRAFNTDIFSRRAAWPFCFKAGRVKSAYRSARAVSSLSFTKLIKCVYKYAANLSGCDARADVQPY
ncbi:MAG TPA: hypothetical protein PK129_13635 [Cellvibrionaceae bacterium]|nr:hypothetical protein [Cellvibrionaceae bacterium]